MRPVSRTYARPAIASESRAFDLALCEKVGLKPLEFDGRPDLLFHEFDRAGQRHMEYVRDRGPFPDVPFETIISDFRANSPHLFEAGAPCRGEFRAEAFAGDSSPSTT